MQVRINCQCGWWKRHFCRLKIFCQTSGNQASVRGTSTNQVPAAGCWRFFYAINADTDYGYSYSRTGAWDFERQNERAILVARAQNGDGFINYSKCSWFFSSDFL